MKNWEISLYLHNIAIEGNKTCIKKDDDEMVGFEWREIRRSHSESLLI